MRATGSSCGMPTGGPSSGTASRGLPVPPPTRRRGPPSGAGTSLPDGTAARPAFELLAQRVLDSRYAPDAVAAATGVPAATIRRLAHEMAHSRLRGDRHPRRPVDGRPRPSPRDDGGAPRRVPRDARDLRPLQRVPDLPGAPRAADAPRDGGRPGRVPLQGAVPEARPAAPASRRPAGPGRGRPAHARPAPRFPARAGGPARRRRRAAEPDRQGVLVGGAHRRPRDDAHRHPQRVGRRSLSHRHPLPVHGEHGLELGHEHRRNGRHAHRPGPRDRGVPDPALHLQRRVRVGDRRLRGPRSPRHDLPRALGLHLHAGPADRLGRRAPPTPSASRWWRPTGTCARSRTCSSRSGPASGFRASFTTTGRRATRAATPTSSPTTSTVRGWAPSRGGGARPARRTAPGSRTPTSSPATSRTAASGRTSSLPRQRYFKHFNRDYLAYAKRMGLVGSDDPVFLQLYCEPLQRFRLAARGHGEVQPPEEHRARVERYFDPLPFWYEPFGSGTATGEGVGSDAVTAGTTPDEGRDGYRERGGGLAAPRGDPAPDGDVPLVGLAERVAPSAPCEQPPLCARFGGGGARSRGRRLGASLRARTGACGRR